MSEHFALPFQLVGASFATVDQDSDEDVVACIVGILRSRINYRDDRPEFGITDPTFRQGGADLEALRAVIDTFEPRAERVLSRDPALLGRLVDRILVAKPATATNA
jgi:hypothetical protein